MLGTLRDFHFVQLSPHPREYPVLLGQCSPLATAASSAQLLVQGKSHSTDAIPSPNPQQATIPRACTDHWAEFVYLTKHTSFVIQLLRQYLNNEQDFKCVHVMM